MTLLFDPLRRMLDYKGSEPYVKGLHNERVRWVDFDISMSICTAVHQRKDHIVLDWEKYDVTTSFIERYTKMLKEEYQHCKLKADVCGTSLVISNLRKLRPKD